MSEGRRGSMWSGEGWTRTRRQLGFFGFIILVTIDVAFGTNLEVPVVIYSVIGSLLGLDILLGGLDEVRKR